LTEDTAIRYALKYLNSESPLYESTTVGSIYPGGRARCDLVIPGQWAVEFKLIRPFGDNGAPAEHWSENILHPYAGNISAIGDCIKLRSSAFPSRKAVIVFGFEHTPPQVDLTVAIRAFEVIATQLVNIELGPRFEAGFGELIHPVHQQVKVFGWEVL
jgi:hypothetical protein